MNWKRILGPILGIVVLSGVGAAVWYSATQKSSDDLVATRAHDRITVRIVSGSEKINLLRDERLVRLLDGRGITLEVQKAGSREIASLPDLRSYDVAFPAGQAAAEKIRQTVGSKRIATAFSTPMVVASWTPIAEVLAASGIVKRENEAWWIVDMAKLLDLMASGKRWRDLPGNRSFAVGKSVLISTTNVSTSNSAAQFLALGSYLFNGAEVVQTVEQAERAVRQVGPLFARQGFQESSSSGPFEDYLTIGMGKAPLVWIYEAQFLEQALQHPVKAEMVLLYPRPTIFTKHVMVALSDKGTRFLDAMADPEAQRISTEFGYRAEGAAGLEAIRGRAKAKGIPLPDLVDLVDAPSYDLLEHMIVAIEQQRDRPGAATTTSLPPPATVPTPAPLNVPVKEKTR